MLDKSGFPTTLPNFEPGLAPVLNHHEKYNGISHTIFTNGQFTNSHIINVNRGLQNGPSSFGVHKRIYSAADILNGKGLTHLSVSSTDSAISVDYRADCMNRKVCTNRFLNFNCKEITQDSCISNSLVSSDASTNAIVKQPQLLNPSTSSFCQPLLLTPESFLKTTAAFQASMPSSSCSPSGEEITSTKCHCTNTAVQAAASSEISKSSNFPIIGVIERRSLSVSCDFIQPARVSRLAPKFSSPVHIGPSIRTPSSFLVPVNGQTCHSPNSQWSAPTFPLIPICSNLGRSETGSSNNYSDGDYDDMEEEEDLESLKAEGRNSTNEFSSSTHSNLLPPIGVFWDIENCQVPKGVSATHVVQAIRSRYFVDKREAEFICVCDTLKENIKILEELNDAQVNIIHVGSTMKNAADDKLLQSMRRFADIHGAGATIVLVSGDTNFAMELSDLRYRKNLYVVLLHNAQAQDSLKLCAHETALFTDVTQQIPLRTPKTKTMALSHDVIVRNLPDGVDSGSIRRRLLSLASNCGGRLVCSGKQYAVLRFQSTDLAARAKKRLESEDVYGNKISCSFGRTSESLRNSHKFSNFAPVKLAGIALLPTPQGYSSPIDFSRFDPVNFVPSCWNTSMGDISYPWKNNMGDSSFGSSSFNPFRSHHGRSSFSMSSDHPIGSGQRSWRPKSSWRSGSNFSPVRMDSQSDDQASAQPLYLDKTPEQFRKGRSSKSHFRMSSPPKFSMNSAFGTSELHPFDSSSKSPTGMLWGAYMSPLKGGWSPPPMADLHSQVMYGLRDMSLTESSHERSVITSPTPVDLQITNLDQNIDAKEMKRIIFNVFREHVMVLHVSVFVQSDGNLAATVRIPSQQDAQFAISKLHRRKIGAKRIIIAYMNHYQPSPELKRSKVIALLQEVPGKKLPLFKFRELYERRFHETIGVSEMYNMRDIVTVSDNTTGRMVSLHPEYRNGGVVVPSPPPQSSIGGSPPSGETEMSLELGSRYCAIHGATPDDSVGWAERDQSVSLPSIYISLRALSASIHSLLQSHSGCLPLASLVECYQAEVGPLEEVEEGGVPLEHLVACLPGICIVTVPAGYKLVHWVENRVVDEMEELARSVSPPLVGQLALFSRELIDLLKTFAQCRLPFARFIPAYHHHFGRQCRVADYGFTKLADLFEALGHVVQVMGEGVKRVLTLSHRAQVKRFSSDLLRVLKGQPTKAITMDVFPAAYEKALGRVFYIVDYGVCDIEDLLTEVCENTVIVMRTETEITLAIPKREQTPEEMERTRQFATESVELLRHSPQCKMPFARFIPAYHHHFGRQCRVADYGFTKLIELFEAIPDVLQVFDDEEDGEKQLQLAEKERLRVLGEQVSAVVRGAPNKSIRITALCQVFTRYYGYSLRAEHYNALSLAELIRKLRNYVKLVETGDEELEVSLVDRGFIHEMIDRTRQLLWEERSCSLPLQEFFDRYIVQFGTAPTLDAMNKDLEDLVVFQEDHIRLVPLQVFARDLLTLLHEAGGRMILLNFETAFLDRFGVACRPASFGYPNLVALVQSLGGLMSVRGRGAKRILVLNKDTAPVPPCFPTPQSPSSALYDDIQTPKRSPELDLPLPPHFPPLQESTPLPREYQHDVSSHMMMGVSHANGNHHFTSPMIYGTSSPSPHTGGSLMWGQVWSPQFPMMPPMSPAHYMVPTIPLSWGTGGMGGHSSAPPNMPHMSMTHAPITIDMLDDMPSQVFNGIVSEESFAAPSASELPVPQIFMEETDTNNLFREDPDDRKSLSDTIDSDDSPDNTPKKRVAGCRLAAQFDSTL